ncbi:MAG: M42 family metallopeptidase [Coriobacteriales bacterium]|jgi:putative aminopeptidase FrvX
MSEFKTDFLKQIVETPSVTGTEWRVAELVRQRLGGVADEIDTDVMGSVHARLNGTDENAPTVLIAAHMDEIGLMVTYISDEGFLSFSSVGGVDAGLLPGLRVDVHTTGGVLRGVVGRMPIHLVPADDRKNVAPMDKLCIDVGLPADEVKARVRIGDTITYGVGFEEFGANRAVSRAFDDKAGVFIGTRVMEELAAREMRPRASYVFAATVQEEIGLRGGETSAFSVNPTIALGFDVTHATDYPGIEKTKFGDIKLGAGPVIARGPNINPIVFDRMVKAAEDEGIAYQIEAEPRVTGTDAGAMQVQRGGIATGLVSLPLRYMHTPTEVISLDDVEGCIKLLARFIEDLDAGVSFIPGC